jgi:toxin-antitoxin system PIN domain toxin
VILPDVNLLVYAYSAGAPHHQRARQWWADAVNGMQPIGLPWVVALGFVRIITSGAVMVEPMDSGTALAHLQTRLEQPSVFLLQPGPRHLSLLRGFAQAG